MNSAHLHLLLNHIPVIGTLFGLSLLIFAVKRNSDELKRISLGVFVVIAILTIPVYLSGGQAEEVIERLPGVADTLIEQHEEAAELSLIAIEILGLIALGGLLMYRRKALLPAWFFTLFLFFTLLTSGLIAWTANLGGQIRHAEARTAIVAPDTLDKVELWLQKEGSLETEQEVWD